VSEPGNLYASHAFIPVMPADAFSFLPLAAAVALCEAVARATGLDPRVKWPNDLLLGGQKVAGILCESEIGGASGTRRAVLGFGVNVAHAPAGLPATHLSEHVADVTAEDILARLLVAVAAARERLATPGGIAALLARWRAAAVGIGEPVTVRLETATMEGRFVDLDETGRLVLERADGTLARIAAGDVFVRAEAP
jgi:BirA family biotin operon repressor/biotin-[acetyl-CoA-carboxylase] ligase